jgi:hypothetical protein
MAMFKVTNLNSVDSILADFQDKVQQLNDLALKRQTSIEQRNHKIKEFVDANNADQQEAEKAIAAANKISSFFN